MKVKLSKPITVAEKTIDEIDLKFDGLTGKDMLFFVREASVAKGESVRVIAIDVDVHIQVAAKAAGLSVQTIMDLDVADFTEVVTTVQSFLTKMI